MKEGEERNPCLLFRDSVIKWAYTQSMGWMRSWMRCQQVMAQTRDEAFYWGPTQEDLVVVFICPQWCHCWLSLYSRKLCSSHMLEQKASQGLIWADGHKATASVFSILGKRASVSLEAGKGTRGGSSGSQGECIIPWEPFRRHITGHHLSAFYFKTSGMGSNVLQS